MAAIDIHNAGLAFQKLGMSINQRVNADLGTLDFHETLELTNSAQNLLLKSKTMFAQAAVEIGAEVAPALRRLTEATEAIDRAIKTIGDVQKVINIATQLVTAAGSVLSGDASGAVTAIGNVITSITP